MDSTIYNETLEQNEQQINTEEPNDGEIDYLASPPGSIINDVEQEQPVESEFVEQNYEAISPAESKNDAIDDDDESKPDEEEQHEKYENDLGNLNNNPIDGETFEVSSDKQQPSSVSSFSENRASPVENDINESQPNDEKLSQVDNDSENYGSPVGNHINETQHDDESQSEVGGDNENRASPAENDINEFQNNDEKHSQADSDKEQKSDVEDSDVDDGHEQKDVGKLISNIFGDESDGEGGQDDNEVRAALQESEDEEKEWDFDRIIAEKKKERSKKRKRRRDGSIDLHSNADGQVRHVVELMKNAAAEDREANIQRHPAIQKTKLLDVARTILMRSDFFEALCENDMMSAISEWLAPLPDKSLPSLEIRTTLLKILDSFPTLEPGLLKQSGLGKAVMLIFKHPKETKENKLLASKLIRNWSQPIFQISADYAAMTRDEREKMDLAHLPEVKRRKVEEKLHLSSPSTSSSSILKEGKVLGPGDKGFIGRARVPKLSTSAYIIRPKPNVEGTFRGESKNFANSRFDKTTRDFKERNKGSQAKRAVGVSIEGRRMGI